MITSKYRIHGIIKTTSPLHIATPGAVRFDPETGGYAGGDKGIPCTGIQQMPLPGTAANRDGISERQLKVPMIAANNLNGGLRRQASAIVFDALLAKGEQVDMGTYSAMTCGSVTGKPDGGLVKFDEYREARAHPFLGLYGGGPRMMRRYVRVHNLVPLTKETQFMHQGASRHPGLDGVEDLAMKITLPESVRMVQMFAFVKNDDLIKLVDVAMQEKVIADFETKMAERQKNILSDKTAKDAGGEGSRFSNRTFTAYEFVIPGVSFPMTFELDVSDEQMGLFMLALDRYAAKERIGGALRNGFGQFVMENVVLVDAKTGEVEKDLFVGGRLNRDEDGPAYKFLKAWDTAAQELSADRLNYLMRPPAEKLSDEEKKEKAAAKKAVKVSKGA